MLELTQNELRELRFLACFNRSTIETSDFADRLTNILLNDNFRSTFVFRVSIPKRTLIKFSNYSLDWENTDTLGIKLREELKQRTT